MSLGDVSACFQVFFILGLYLHPGHTYTGPKLKNFCYFTNWSNKLMNFDARFELTDINTTLCSHMIYAHAKVDSQRMTLARASRDDGSAISNGHPINTQGRYFDFTELCDNSGVVPILSVGGPSGLSSAFGDVVQSVETMTLFSRNCAVYLRDRNFKGINIDWEWPNDILFGVRSDDTYSVKYTQLLKIMRNEFDNEASESGMDRLLITITGAADEHRINYYNITEIVKYVDYILVMAYDFYGTWSLVTGFSAPLYSRSSNTRLNPQLNQAWAIDKWLARGAPSNKVVLGLTGSAITFILADRSLAGVGEGVTGPGKPGPYIRQEGQIPYYRVCELIRQGAMETWDDEQKMAYAVLNDQWMGFGDPRSMKQKVEFAYSRRLAGTMFWSLELDDFKGFYCNKGKFPLLTAVHDAILAGPAHQGLLLSYQ